MENTGLTEKNILTGKHILFVGGIGGIGSVTAKLLLQTNVNLTLTTLPGNPAISNNKALFNEIIEQTNSSSKFQIIETDITVEEDLKKQIQKAKEAFGDIDHLVITAGVSHLGKLLDVTRKEWDLLIDTNVWGILRTIQETLPHLSKGSNIVVIGSDVGLGKPSHDIPLYSISKTTLHSVITLLSQELPKFGISISGVAPYNTPPGMRHVYHAEGKTIVCEAEDCSTPDWGNLPPTGKFIDANSIAKTILLLLQSSGDFNGTIVPITGGYGLTIS